MVGEPVQRAVMRVHPALLPLVPPKKEASLSVGDCVEAVVEEQRLVFVHEAIRHLAAGAPHKVRVTRPLLLI